MPVTIIADLGINHNGDLELLKNMALAATMAGADFVKIQKRCIDLCYTDEELSRLCPSPWGVTVYDKVAGRELSLEDVEKFDFFCRKHGFEWFASCFDLRSFDLISRRFPELRVNKVPSCMATYGRSAFLKDVAAQKKQTLVSTGLCRDWDEVDAVLTIFELAKCPYIVNHCVALYPCPTERLNLNAIKEMRLRYYDHPEFPHCVGVGYSGHEVGLLPSVVAAQMGATCIERHFTLDRSMYGGDQAASVEPQGFQRMVRDIRALDAMRGSGDKFLVGDEKNPISRFEENLDGS